MYGCDHSIDGCLQVSAFRIGEGINVYCERIGITPNGLQTSAYRIGSGIFAYCTRVDKDMIPSKGIIADAYRIGNGLKVTCGIVCGVGVADDNYLLVKEGLFILSDGRKFKLREDELSK